MSARQLKRLEAMQQTGGVASSSDSDELPDTMKRKPNTKRKRNIANPTGDADASSSPPPPATSLPAPPAHNVAASKPKTSDGSKQTAKKAAPANNTATKPRSNRRRHDDDDDDFEKVLQQYAGAQLAPSTDASTVAPSGAVAVAAAPSTDAPTTLDESSTATESERPTLPTLATLLTADKRTLDPRNERIKAFGVSSVENLTPKHAHLPRFRASLLQTPNPNEWPPYDGLGLRIDAVHVQTRADGGKATMYQVQTSSQEFQAATRELKAVVNDPYAGIQGMMDVMRRYPYHVPTLIQLHKTFMTTGDGGIAQQCLDMALFTVGIALHPILGKSGVDAMLLPSPGASMLLEVLKLGVYSAMRKGCAKTALELAKLMLSIDSSDPDFALLFVDYIAIRASAFDWMIQTFAAAEQSKSTAVHCLASWRFNVALAAHLRAKKAASAKKSVEAAATRLPIECDPILEDDGVAWLTKAVCRHPAAAAAVADRAGMRLEDPLWVDFIQSTTPKLSRATGGDSFASRHTDSLFAERCGELWKMPLAMDLMKSAVAKAVKLVASTGGVLPEMLTGTKAKANGEDLLLHYRGATLDDVMFAIAKGIPRELLEAGPTPEEQAAAEAAAMRAQLPPEIAESLDRLEAAFGPLPPDVPAEQRLAIYEDMLAERIGNLGDSQSAFGLFLRTLLPWNTPRELALRDAMTAAGVEDPTVTRRREARRREAETDVEFVEYHTSDDDDDEGAR